MGSIGQIVGLGPPGRLGQLGPPGDGAWADASPALAAARFAQDEGAERRERVPAPRRGLPEVRRLSVTLADAMEAIREGARPVDAVFEDGNALSIALSVGSRACLAELIALGADPRLARIDEATPLALRRLLQAAVERIDLEEALGREPRSQSEATPPRRAHAL